MKKFLAVLCMVSMCTLGWAENWCQWMPDSTTIVGHADLGAVRDLPFIANLITGTDNISRFTSTVREWTAIDLDSISHVWFGVAGKDNTVFVLQGTFNLTTIRGVLGGIEKFRVETPANAEFAVTMPDDKRPGQFNTAAFISPTHLAFGRPPLVTALLDNVAQKRQHAHAADFAMLDKPLFLIECVALKFPNDDGKTPRFIVENTRRLHLGIDCDEAITAQLTIQPVKTEMVAPLAQIGTGVAALLPLLPPEQISLQGLPRVLLNNAKVTSTQDAVILASSLPMNLIQPLLASKITPPAPPPQAPPTPAPQPAGK